MVPQCRIEIQGQPERNRFWAEVELGGLIARCVKVTAADFDEVMNVVRETYYEMNPQARPKVRAGIWTAVDQSGARWDYRADPRFDKMREAKKPWEMAYRETLLEAGFSEDEIVAIEADMSIDYRVEMDDPLAVFTFPRRPAQSAERPSEWEAVGNEWPDSEDAEIIPAEQIENRTVVIEPKRRGRPPKSA